MVTDKWGQYTASLFRANIVTRKQHGHRVIHVGWLKQSLLFASHPFPSLENRRALVWVFIANICLLESHTACFYQKTIQIILTHQHLNSGQFAHYTVYLFSRLQFLWCIFLRQLICSWILFFVHWLPISLVSILRLAGTCRGFFMKWKKVSNKPIITGFMVPFDEWLVYSFGSCIP